jgi:hypothetical protein
LLQANALIEAREAVLFLGSERFVDKNEAAGAADAAVVPY